MMTTNFSSGPGYGFGDEAARAIALAGIGQREMVSDAPTPAARLTILLEDEATDAMTVHFPTDADGGPGDEAALAFALAKARANAKLWEPVSDCTLGSCQPAPGETPTKAATLTPILLPE